MTTDIKGRLSGLGKQWKEKLTAEPTAEEAMDASPAENAVREAQGAAASVEQDAAVRASAPEQADKMTAEDAAKGGSGEEMRSGEPAGEPEKEPPEASESKRISDAELARILLAFGWQVPKEEKSGRPFAAGSTLTSPALEDLAAEVTVCQVYHETGGDFKKCAVFDKKRRRW